MIAAALLSLVLAADAGPDALVLREQFFILTTGRAPYRNLREEAKRNLAAAAPASILFIADFMDLESPREGPGLRDIASEMGPTAGPALVDALAQADTAGRRMSILLALGTCGDSSTAELVEAHLKDPDRRVRVAAAVALGDFALPRSVPALAETLRDSEPVVRRLAADALRRIFGNTAVDTALRAPAKEALESALSDVDPWVRRNAAKGLNRLPEAALDRPH